MLEEEIRKAVVTLEAKGFSQRDIAEALDISRNSVKAILREGVTADSGKERGSRLDEHLEAIRALHQKCRDKRGRVNLVRVHEKLKDQLAQEGKTLEASYSALT